MDNLRRTKDGFIHYHDIVKMNAITLSGMEYLLKILESMLTNPVELVPLTIHEDIQNMKDNIAAFKASAAKHEEVAKLDSE